MIFNNEQCQVVTFKDVSAIKEISKLSADNKMLNLLSSQISHEMLTPLRCIIQITNQVKDGFSNNSTEYYNLKVVSNTANIVLSQIKGNLDKSLINANQFQPNLEEALLIEDVVRPAVDIFVAQARSQNVQIKIKNQLEDLKTDQFIRIDKLRIQQILINLVQNSIKFSKVDDTIFVSISRKSQQQGQITFQIKVTDHGEGIAKEDQDRMFNKYFQSSRKMGKESHGLGLGICK